MGLQICGLLLGQFLCEGDAVVGLLFRIFEKAMVIW